MSKHLVRIIWAVALGVAVRSASAAPPPATSLNNCQNAVKTATKAFVTNKVTAIGGCLQAVSTQIVKNNAADASGAAQHLRHAVPQDQRQPRPGQAAERQAGRRHHQEVRPELPDPAALSQHAYPGRHHRQRRRRAAAAQRREPQRLVQPLRRRRLDRHPAGVDRLPHRRGRVRRGLDHRQPVPARARVAEPREAVDAGALATGRRPHQDHRRRCRPRCGRRRRSTGRTTTTSSASSAAAPSSMAGVPAQPLRTGQTTVRPGCGHARSLPGRTGRAGRRDAAGGDARLHLDNANGTITDNKTGLMWEKLDDNNAGGIHD